MHNIEPNMAASESRVDCFDWRKDIISQLQNRNRSQSSCFQDLITFHNRLFDSSNALRSDNLQLSIQNEKLRQENLEISQRSGSSHVNGKPNEKIQLLEQKLMHQQEELTELHRRKGENAQQLIDLNVKLQEKERLFATMQTNQADSLATISTLRLDIHRYQTTIKDLEGLNQLLRDEHQALQLTFTALEEKLKKEQMENRTLLDRLIKYKSKDADKMNEENENFVRKKQAKVKKELEDAAKETGGISPDKIKDGAGAVPFFIASIPANVAVKFDAHDGEVNAVKWSPSDRLLATGGSDRKVKLWDISKGFSGGFSDSFSSRVARDVGQCEAKGVLVGSNAAVMSIDFDSTGTLILGASSDFASRVWTVVDQRLRHTLTGHSGKVMAAKFLGEPSKVVSGSHDRTLKIWDLRSKACTETKFAGSSCNDLVTSDGAGSTIISGHFDKRIRFWDTRSETSSNDIVLQGKVTSLDLSRDSNYLLACVRDDSLKMLDLRMNQIVGSFCADGFKVGCDWSRAGFSPDGKFIAAGAVDGSVFVWSVSPNKVESVLKEHTCGLFFGRSAVTAISWHVYCSSLASVDKAKRVIIWE